MLLNVDEDWSSRTHACDAGSEAPVHQAMNGGRVARNRVRRVALSLATTLCLASSGASALGLGTASLESSLGEPLRLSLPVTLQPDEDIGCIQVRARGDDLPSVFNTRSNVVRSGSQTRIEISSAQPVVEPTIGLVVMVGCSSPVSREFVLFLDPPVVTPRQSASDEVPRSVVEPTVPRRLNRPALRRPDGTAASIPRSPKVRRSAESAAPPPRKTRLPRPPAGALPATGSTVPDAATTTAKPPAPTAPLQSATPATGTRDRLSIAPQIPAPAAQTPSATAPAAASNVLPGASSTTATVGASPAPGSTTQPAPDVAAPASVAAANASADVELMAREQALRQQRDALQARISTLGDQIAALRAQTANLTTRNQALEDSIISPLWFWLMAALALIAIIAAAWMTRSYLALRRSVESSDWWAATQASSAATGADDGDLHDDLVPLDAGTRMSTGAARPVTRIDPRTSQVTAPLPVVSNVDRTRTVTRAPAYQPAIETDFTVSDIEVAMAAVRTVSPPRAPQPHLSDSDLGQLGGPTEPLPYSDPPPAMPPGAAGPAMSPSARAGFASETSTDPLATFADLNVPPLDVGGHASGAAPPASQPPAPLDFKLEIPENYDPLESDAYKRTEFDRTSPGRAIDFEETMPMSSAPPPVPLDFELPTATSILSAHDQLALAQEEKHGATALDNLFASDTGKLGVDTILNLDERDNAALSASDVGRFTSTAIDNPSGASQATVQGRMSRFADLMNQVDEAAAADPLRAIALLRQYVLRDENIPTILWLRLFELYKVVNKKPVYEALAEHFARRYRRPMVAWNEKLADRVPQTPLSAFKELDSQIEASWGMEIGLDRLQTLLCDYDQSDAIVFNAVLQRDLLDAAKIFLLDRDSSITPAKE